MRKAPKPMTGEKLRSHWRRQFLNLIDFEDKGLMAEEIAVQMDCPWSWEGLDLPREAILARYTILKKIEDCPDIESAREAVIEFVSLI